jgi:hypothetical protein
MAIFSTPKTYLHGHIVLQLSPIFSLLLTSLFHPNLPTSPYFFGLASLAFSIFIFQFSLGTPIKSLYETPNLAAALFPAHNHGTWL